MEKLALAAQTFVGSPSIDLPIERPAVRAERQKLRLARSSITTGLHWICQDWNPEYVIPANTELKRGTRELANWLIQIWDLIDAVKQRSSLANLPNVYGNLTVKETPTDIWLHLICEDYVWCNGLAGMCQGERRPYTFKPSKSWSPNKGQKESCILMLNQFCSKAKARTPVRRESTDLALWALLDYAILLCSLPGKGPKAFKKKFFNPFIEAWRLHIAEIQKYAYCYKSSKDGERLCRTAGRGTALIPLPTAFDL